MYTVKVQGEVGPYITEGAFMGFKPNIQRSLFAVFVTLIVFLGGLLALTQPGLAEEIAIAAASVLNFAIKDVIVEYEKATGNHV